MENVNRIPVESIKTIRKNAIHLLHRSFSFSTNQRYKYKSTVIYVPKTNDIEWMLLVLHGKLYPNFKLITL